MKKLKFRFFNASAYALMLVMMMSLMMACQKVEVPDLPDANTNVSPPEEEIYFEIGGLKSVMTEDGILTERFTEMILTANPSGLAIEHWYWTITDGSNVISFDDQSKITYAFQSASSAYCSIELSGVGTGVSQSVLVEVETCADFSMSPPVIMQKTWYLGNSLFRVQFAIVKARVRFIPGNGSFFYTGNMPNSNWVPINLSSADTNLNLASNMNEISPPNGEMGKYYLIRMDLPLGNYEIGTGKFLAAQAIWADFSGQPGTEWVDSTNTAVIKFTVLSGSVIPSVSQSNNLPGIIGDIGSDPVLRFDFSTSTFDILFNNFSTFTSSKYYQLRNVDFTWQTATAQVALADYPSWGKGTLSYGSGINGSLFRLRYGNSITSPQNYNTNSHLSTFWDGYDKELSFLLQDIQIITKSGEINHRRIPLLLLKESVQ